MDTRTGIKLGKAFQVLFRVYQMPYEWQMRNRSGLHRVTLPSISFINIRCQSRLEGNNR